MLSNKMPELALQNKAKLILSERLLNHIDIIPINGTTSINHMIEDLKISDFELSKEEIEAISNLTKR